MTFETPAVRGSCPFGTGATPDLDPEELLPLGEPSHR